MATIEERAAQRYENPQEPYCFETDREQQWYRCGECDGYIAGATEQDRIARADERERCMRNLKDLFCGGCDVIGHEKCKLGNECPKLIKIRKAMEGGEK